MAVENWSDVADPASGDDWSSVASPVGEKPKKQNSGIAGDLLTGLKRGVEQMPGMATGALDIVAAPFSSITGINRPFSRGADYLGEKTGFRPEKWAEQAQQEYSPEMQASLKKVQEAEGFLPTLGALAENPRAAVNLVAESAPSTLAGGLLARGAMGAVAGAERLAAMKAAGDTAGLLKAGAIAGGIGEGAVTAGQQMAQTDYDVYPLKAAGAALASGAITGAIGAGSGRLANSAIGRKLGLSDIETSIAAGTLGQGAAKAGPLGYARRIGAGIAQEGLLEEAPQSYSEQVFQNIANDRPWSEGAASAAAQGAMAGGIMGGAINAIPGRRYAESKAQEKQQESPDEQQAISGLLPSPTYTGTPGSQIVENDAARQSAIDAADKNAADLYAMRDAFEKERQNVVLVADPVPVQQRIDAMLGLDTERMDKKGRALYEKDLADAFNEQIGITHDANQREVPFTMGEYLDAQVRTNDAVRAREQIPAQSANQKANDRLAQLADEEAQQNSALVQDLTRSAAQGGALSKAALTGIRAGAVQMPANQERVAIEQQMQEQTTNVAQTPVAEVTDDMRLDGKRAAYAANAATGAPDDVTSSVVMSWQKRTNERSEPMNIWRSVSGALGLVPANQKSPFVNGELLGTMHPDKSTQPTTSQLQQTTTQLNMPAQNISTNPVTNVQAGAQFDVSQRKPNELAYLASNGKPGWKEAATAELQLRGIQVSTAATQELPTTPEAQKADNRAKLAQVRAENKTSSRRQIDSTKDTLFQAIAKLGGMDTKELVGNGFDPKDITYETAAKVSKKTGKLGKKSRLPLSLGFNMPLHKNGGMSFDGMLEAVKQYGYLPEDATKNDAIEAFRRELGGGAVMTPDATMRQAEEKAEQEANDVIGYDNLEEREKALVDFHAETVYDDDNPIEAFKRGMRRDGATEEEINETIKQTFGAQEVGGNDSAESPQGTGEARDAQGLDDGIKDGEIQQGVEPDWLNEGFGLAAQSPEELRAKADQERAAAAQAHKEEVKAIRAEQAAKNKAEKDRRAAQVLAEREAAKKAEVDKAAEDFALGQAAPEPVVKKVTTEDARGQQDVFAQPALVGYFDIYKDGISGKEIPSIEVTNGNSAFQYALGKTEEDGKVAIFRRKESERGTYGGWRWEADHVKQPEQKAEQPARGEVGASLTKAERSATLKTLVDVYRKNRAPKEFKGLDNNGNERYGYAYSPEYFVKSDITGSMVRYYVTLPDGRVAHPTELFSDYTQSNIDAALQKQIDADRTQQQNDDFRLKTLESRKGDTLNEANGKFNAQNRGRADYVPAILTDGKQFIRTPEEQVERDLQLLGENWKKQESAQPAQEASTAEPKAVEPAQDNDWLGALFQQGGNQVEEDAKDVAQAADKSARVDAAIAMLTGEIEATNAVAAELAARKYKQNRKQIELVGDGPGKNGSMSISAINESRRRRSIEAAQNTTSAMKKAIEFISENPDDAFKQVLDMESAVTKQFNEGFFGKSAKIEDQLDMAVGSLIGASQYSGVGSAGRKLRMAAHVYFADDKPAAPAEVPGWFTEIPKTGVPLTQDQIAKKPTAYQSVVGLVAQEAWKAISQNQRTSMIGLYAYVKPAEPGYNGIVRLFPDDQTPPAPWSLLDPQVIRQGGMTKEQGEAKLRGLLGRAPIIGEPAAVDAKKEAETKVSEETLIDLRLLQELRGRWQYKFGLSAGWMTANTKEDAVERATTAYFKTPENERLTSKQRAELASAEELAQMDRQYGRMTIDELRAEYKRLGADVVGNQRAGEREFDGNGGRRTRSATSNEAARIAGEERMKLERYIAKKESAASPDVTLDSVKSEFDKQGIKHSLYENKGVISLSKIVVPEKYRGNGKGSAAMRLLTEYADKTNQRIVLSPSSDFGGNKNRLIGFYKQFGFVENKGRNKDFSTMESMYRDANKDDGGIRYSKSAEFVPDNALTEAAKKHFGVTNDLREAGYIMPDGTMLDFSGKHYANQRDWPYLKGQRNVDHRELTSENTHTNSTLDKYFDSTDANDLMQEFMAKTGAMRVDFNSSVSSIMRPPTSQQTRAIGLIKGWSATSYIDPESGRIISEAEFENTTPAKVRSFFAENVGKKADKNSALFSKASNKSWYYSQLSKAIEQAPDRVFTTGSQIKLWLAGNKSKVGIKDDEIQWTGINDYLDLQGKAKVTKADVLAYLDGNGVQVQEVMLDERQTPTDHLYETKATKYASYQLPGGTNYRELLLTLPEKNTYPQTPVLTQAEQKRMTELVQKMRRDGNLPAAEMAEWRNYKDQQDAYQQELDDLSANGKNQKPYRSAHWQEPNILAHIRMNDRTDADGKKVLFIEEVQSDWNQDGRKKGFATGETKRLKGVVEQQDQTTWKVVWEDGTFSGGYNWAPAMDVAEKGKSNAKDGVVAGPFVTDTKAAVALSVKRITAYAAENGYDKVAFINGEQSAERYDLSKQISSLDYYGDERLIAYGEKGKVLDKRVSPEELEDVIGKDAAKKLMDQPLQKTDDSVSQGMTIKDKRSLRGADLKVGGEGMKTFYDRIVPQVLSDVLKKVGGKMDAVSISNSNNRYTVEQRRDGAWAVRQDGEAFGPPVNTEEEAQKVADRINGEMDQPGFTITPEMREKVAGGLPLFARNNSANTESIPRSQAEAGIRRVLGDKAARVLLESGIISFVNEGNKFQGATYRDGSIVLNLDSLNDANIGGVLAHEGFHSAVRDLVGAETFDAMLQRLEDLGKNTKTPWVREAEQRAIYAKTSVDKLTEEVAAYAIEAYQNGDKLPLGIRRWVDSFLSMLRTAIIKHMPNGKLKLWAINNIQPQDLASLAIAGLKAKAQGQLQAQGSGEMAYSKINQTDTPAFKKWFGSSKVVDADGNPLVVYHGTRADVNVFDTFPAYFTSENSIAGMYAERVGGPTKNDSPNVLPVYLKIENPGLTDGGILTQELLALKSAGHDGATDGKGMWVALHPEQIKSAIGNNGKFDGTNPDIRYSKSRIIGASTRSYNQDHTDFFKRVGRTIDEPSFLEKLGSMRKDFAKKMATGIVDQFRGLKDLGPGGMQAYILARLSKGSAGAFEALLHHGKLRIKDNVFDADTSGGFIERLGVPLNGELEDFLWWVAANRAEALAAEGKENLFTKDDIIAGKSLAADKTSFDYTLPGGATTRNRALIYKDALRIFNEFNKNTLDMAEQSGLIDGASRPYWENQFYVPFYRVSEEDNEFIGSNIRSGLVRQRAFEKLKGGTDKLNSDLLSNTLMNWSHLIDASAKNRAAKASLQAAEQAGVAQKVAPNMASYAQSNGAMLPPGTKKTVWYMDNGQKQEYKVTDPFVMTAITGLEYAGIRSPVMDVLSKFKHWLTIGVTASPAFKVRNLIRDSIQAIGTSDLGYNPISNVARGFKATNRASQEYVSALAGGGLIRFGTMMEGNEAARTRQLIKSGVKDASILNSEGKIQQFYDRVLEPAVMAYNEIGNRGEEINRMALYNQLISQGKSHAEASLLARDLMDFSMQGSFNTIRLLTQIIPFMNARLQGMYKLGRAAKEDPRKLAIVTGAVALASIALMLGSEDDDDWKKREDWDRDNYWWFKIGDTAWRIPKPFEVGAVATLAERSVELMLNDEMNGERYRKILKSLLLNNLSMNPVPQAIKPIVDLYANKDSFTGRPIENMSMQRLDPSERYTSSTSLPARAVSASVGGALSPVQVDHLVRSYFSWLGTFVVGGADMLSRAMSNEPTSPTMDYLKFATQGIGQQVGSSGSRYITQMYDQANELEQAHATWNHLKREGRIEEAKEYMEEHADELKRYKPLSHVKQMESKLNERIRAIERSNIDPDQKKEQIDNVKKMKDQVARRVAPGLD